MFTARWPEFARNGKGAITVRDVLAHRSGLAQFRAETGFRPRDFLDWERTVWALEAMSPFWQPGSAYMYHAFTFGQLLGEIVRRVTGESIGDVFSREIAAPLGLNIWIGLSQQLRQASG